MTAILPRGGPDRGRLSSHLSVPSRPGRMSENTDVRTLPWFNAEERGYVSRLAGA